MSIKEKRKSGAGVFFLPLIMAVPIIAAGVLGILCFGPKISRLLNILIKLVVRG